MRTHPSCEHRLIAHLSSLVKVAGTSPWTLGIGDDAAVRTAHNGERMIVTTDTCMEGVHFRFNLMTPAETGARALITNLSDCAAMGATPDAAVVTLMFPPAHPDHASILREFYRGMGRVCRRWNCPVVGGDLSRGPCFALAITLMGKLAPGERVLTRTGILPGDTLWATGCPGKAAAGLALMNRYGRQQAQRLEPGVVRAHVVPRLHLDAARTLASMREVHACMDLSDGLSKDGATLCAENNLKLVLSPPSPRACRGVLRAGKRVASDWREWYYHGGEDYLLLFAAAPRFDPNGIGVRSVRLGTFHKGGAKVWYYDDAATLQPLPASAWDHLAQKETVQRAETGSRSRNRTSGYRPGRSTTCWQGERSLPPLFNRL